MTLVWWLLGVAALAALAWVAWRVRRIDAETEHGVDTMTDEERAAAQLAIAMTAGNTFTTGH